MTLTIRLHARRQRLFDGILRGSDQVIQILAGYLPASILRNASAVLVPFFCFVNRNDLDSANARLAIFNLDYCLPLRDKYGWDINAESPAHSCLLSVPATHRVGR